MAAPIVRAPRVPNSGSMQSANVKRYTLEDVRSGGSKLPNRIGLHTTAGWGKTSLGTHTPQPIFMQSRGETGLETLIDAGQVGETSYLPECQSWEEVNSQIRFLIDGEHGFRTLVFDTINGFERLLHEYICHRDFSDDWGEKGFVGYQRGYKVSLAEWRMFLNDVNKLRVKKKMAILMLIHTKVKSFKNPMGSDYDRYVPDMNEETWGLTHGWLDAVFFGNFEVFVQKTKKDEADITKKGKGVGGSMRILYTERTAAYDAKNRLGLPEEIEMGDSSAEAWTNLATAIKTARQQSIGESTESSTANTPTDNTNQEEEELVANAS